MKLICAFVSPVKNVDTAHFMTDSMDLISCSPALKKWGCTGFTLSFHGAVVPLFCDSLVLSQFGFRSLS